MVLFCCLTKLGAKRPKWCKSSCHEVVSEFFATNVGTPLNPKHMFHSVLYYFCAFGTVRLHYKTQCETGQTDAKFVPRSRVGIFHSERTRSTPLDSKLMFWCVLYYLDAFGPFCCLTKTQCKTGRTGAIVCATESGLMFLHQTHPIVPVET